MRIGSGLAKLGLKKGDVILIFSPNSIDYMLVVFGAQLAGAIVSTANPSYTTCKFSLFLSHCLLPFADQSATLSAAYSGYNKIISLFPSLSSSLAHSLLVFSGLLYLYLTTMFRPAYCRIRCECSTDQQDSKLRR